ncbi:MAG: aminotransferase class I/II-fold pyridoxal phosphate-dependent enzyme [Clostridia bacterium]|nr:aminotransferase class I/II-fold pyridoxal phosphate-dependent enzyme [Clostridia bacterium]
MKYDFTTLIDRHGKDAIAVEGLGNGHAPGAPKGDFDAIPMWVADMNFPCAPTIQEEIIKRTEHPCFGYFAPRKEYFDCIIEWQKKHNDVEGLLPEHIGYENGVLGGVISALNVMASRGDNILLHSPTYVGFTGVLNNNGYKAIHSPLYQDETEKWMMDYEDMEKKIVENNIHVAIFCSPYNPCGRVWTKDEIKTAMDLFEKYDVQVVSDEIWSDMILFGNKHTPTQSVSEYAKENTVALYAPSKTFNLAGLVGSYHIIYNKKLRERVMKESSLCHYNSMNVLSMYALIGGYSATGEEWLKELLEVIGGNVEFAVNYINDHFKGVKVFKPEGTYMLFVDCTEWCKEKGCDVGEVLRKCWDVGVAVQDGRGFFGNCHVRMNLASPLSQIKKAFERMDKYVFNA